MIEAVDSITSPQTTGQPIPREIMQAPAVLAYIAGNSWRTYGPYSAARPDLAKKGWIVSVTLTAFAKARCYDIEPGGGTNGNIGAFMRTADRQHGLPWLYTFASNGQAMVDAARSFGYERGRDYYYLSAHPGQGRHICAPGTCGYPQADGTQYLFAGSFDRSTLSDYMLPTPQDLLHYDRLDTTGRDLGHGHSGSELSIVEEYDRKRKYRLVFPRRLRHLKDACGILAARIENVEMSGDPDGLQFHRAWRHDELTGRKAGRRYV